MRRPPRRQVLASIAAGGWTGVAGCSRSGRDGTPAATVAGLSYTAEVLEQPSTAAPASIRATLTTEAGSAARIGTRETVALGFVDGPEYAVLLFPETPVGPNEVPSEPSAGCWRYTDADYLVRDRPVWHDVEPGEALAETYRLYTRGEARSCLPDGDYRFAETVRDEAENELEVRVDVALNDGSITVDASEERL